MDTPHMYRQLSDSGVEQPVRSDLPTGTVTFLLSDVEGSTRLWESEAEEAPVVIARHYELLDAAIVLHGGLRPVEQGEGDSVVGVFACASDAVAAALDVQRAFANEPWPGESPLRIRVALHTGEAQLRDAGNYFGPTVIRCARLRATAHGGQTIVSDATRELVVDALPVGGELRDLGSHRLKDLGRAERVWQLVHPDLPDDFAPLRSLSVLPTNLPLQLSSFVGRETEVLELADALTHHRLVTLTGAGGCGKTRLALQTAAETVDRYPDGLWSVELAATSHAEEVAQTVARVLGLREEHDRPLVDTIAEQLRDLDVMLVLDNCEQVLEGSARLVERLLQLAPRLRVLATSREPLGVDGELTWRVPSLDDQTGCALFADRAAQARRGFSPDAAEQGVIAEIVSRLDGIPLAIELAAARVRMMHPSRILAALDDRFRLLTGGSRTMMPRQQTLEASVAWSYDLLDVAEQTLARRLSILHGFTLETAEAVGSDDVIDEYAILELLTRLVDKSLVHVVDSGPDTRYRMLETVRQFLHGHLIAEGEAEPVRQRQLTHFLGVAELLAPTLAFADGPNQLARLQTEHDNLEDALEWAASTGSSELMLRLATALTLFWELRGHLVSGGRWFLRALGADDAEVSVVRARALWGAAHVAFYGGDYATALQRAGESLAMAETSGDDWAAARALNTVGVMQALISPAAARETLERSIEFGESIGDGWAVADGWKMLTVAWHVQHDADGIRAPLDQLRRTGEQLGSPFFLAWYEVMVGYFARDRGDFATARTAFERSLEYCREFGEPSTGGFAEVWLDALTADEGALEAASQHLAAFLARAAASGGELAMLEGAFALGQIALAIGDTAGARAIAEPSIAAGREVGVPGWVAQVLIVLAAARRADGDTEGATAALDEAADLVTHLENASLDALIAYERAGVARRRGDDAAAEDLLHGALALQARAELRPGVVLTLEALAAVVLDADSPAEAVRCLGAADTLRRDIGLVRRPIDESGHAACLARGREQLGDAEFEANWKAAATLPLSEIVEYVARARGERKRPSTGWASLTPTELRVVALVAKGLTNPQIAERMFIARGTAKVHLGHIFEKLGVTSRSQLASEATARAVTDPT